MRKHASMGVLFQVAAVVAVVAVALVAGGCSESPLARIGASCGGDADCESDLCLESTCLDPLADNDGDGLVNEREGRLGTNPLDKDSDGDTEADGSELSDTDGDAIIDALESNASTADGDHDCLPEEVDPHNTEFDATCVSGQPPCVATLVTRFCLTVGVCGTQLEKITAQCNAELAGQADAVLCGYAQVTGYEATTETLCDSADNNCDGATDEALAGLADTNRSRCSREGVCAAFAETPVATCTGGAWLCDFAGALAGYEPGTELSCDALDNDCDGASDEDFEYLELGAPLAAGAACGLGACAGGAVQCNAAHEALTCSTAGSAQDERCDRVDNDCDGQTDEGFEVAGVAVGGRCQGTGACSGLGGVLECRTAGAADCSTNFGGSEWGGSAELCDGAEPADNDCDGRTDEEPVLAPDAEPVCRQLGACVGLSPVFCGAGGEPECDYAAIPHYEPAEQSCDARDNNCDGYVDERLTQHFTGAPTSLAPGVPPDRTDFAAALAPDRHRLVLFGGSMPSLANWPGSPAAADTWELDYGTGRWQRAAAGLTPPAREGARLLYDQAGGRMLLVGGSAYSTDVPPVEIVLADLWAYSLDTHTWTEMTPVGGFPQSAHRAAVLANRGGRTELWIVGGVTRTAGEQVFAYSYALGEIAGTYWDSASADFYDVAVAYDPANDRLVIVNYLDLDTGSMGSTTYIVDLAGLEGPTLRNAQAEVVGYMSPPSDAALAYAPASGTQGARMVLFTTQQPISGADPAAAVWVMDLEAAPLRWVAASFPGDSVRPAPRGEAAAALSPADGRLYVGLGTDPEGFLARDVWSVNLETNRWRTEGSLAVFPPPRLLAGSALDVEHGQWYVYGGAFQSKFGVRLRKDLWRFDLATRAWELIDAPGGDMAVGTVMVFDPQRNRLIGIGGAMVDGSVFASDVPADTFWTLDLATKLWTAGTLSANGGPGPLVGHSAVYAADIDSLLAYGGYGSDGVSGALWRLDLANDTWSELPAQGAAPLPRAGHFAVYDAGRMYVLGGADSPVMDVFDVATGRWLPGTELAGTAHRVYQAVFDPFSKEILLVTEVPPPGQSLTVGPVLDYAAVTVSLATPDAPTVAPYPELGLPDGPMSFLAVPATYDIINRGALVLAGPHGATYGGGLWGIPQVCPAAD